MMSRLPAPAGPPISKAVPIYEAELAAPPEGDERPSLLFWLAGRLASGAEWLFGLLSMILILAVLATIPVLQVMALGYMLEAAGRVARSGRLRDGLIGLRQAARIGSVVIGTWLTLLPMWYVSDLWYAANLISPSSPQTGVLRGLQLGVSGLLIAHILAAWYCGGRLRHFFWPFLAPVQLGIWTVRAVAASRGPRWLLDHTLGLVAPRLVRDICRCPRLTDWFVPAIVLSAFWSGRMYREARDRLWQFVAGLNLPHYFWLGLRGLVGGVVWLIVPVGLIGASRTLPQGAAVLVGMIGTVLLAWVALYLPFLQAHMAAENRWRAIFAVRTIRRAFCRAPVAFLFALAATLLGALPLYLLKVELTQAELAWLPAIVFVVFLYPARLWTGWALGRSWRRSEPRWFPVRWICRLATVPVALVYALVVLATPYIAWYGLGNLLEQHAFLVPVPFVGF